MTQALTLKLYLFHHFPIFGLAEDWPSQSPLKFHHIAPAATQELIKVAHLSMEIASLQFAVAMRKS